MDGKTLARIGAIVFVAVAITATVLELTREPQPQLDAVSAPAAAAPSNDDRARRELRRCQRLGEAARELLAGIELRQAVRLIGVRAENLVPAGSAALTLWDADEDWRKVEDALDDAADRFGGGVVTRASLVGRRDRVTGGRGEADVRRRGEAPGGRTHGGAER